MPRRTVVDPRFAAHLREQRKSRKLSQQALASAAYIGSKSTISELENGVTRPSVEMATHLDQVLNAGGSLAALVTEAEEIPAQHAGTPIVLLNGDLQPGRPLDAGDVAQLRDTVTQLVALDNAYGGDDTHRLAVRVFRTASGKLATGAYTPKVESDLQAAVGEIGEVAAWMLYDADRQDDSRRLNMEAITVSRLAGDRAIELLELANMAMQSVYLRRGREALRIAESVLAGDDLSPRVAGLFHVRRARALAELGDRHVALDALDQARSLVTDGTGNRDPAWAWWIDGNELTWHAAMLHSAVGEDRRAVDLFEATIRDYPTVGRRQYNNLAHLLDALTTVEAWRDAEPIMVEVLPYVDEIGSARTERLLAATVDRIGCAEVPSTVDDLASALGERLSAVR